MTDVPMETVENVFGSTNSAPTIPEQALKALSERARQYGFAGNDGKILPDKAAMLKQRYVDLLNTPGIRDRRAKGEDVWLMTVRALAGALSGEVFTNFKTHPFLVVPVSVSSRPIKRQDERKGTSYTVRLSGLAESMDPEVVYKGPATVMVFGYPTENEAQRVLDGLPARKPVVMKLNVGKNSPVGNLGKGEIGFLTGNANEPFSAPPPSVNGGPWADLYAPYVEACGVTQLAELLQKPQENFPYRVEVTVSRWYVNSGKNGTTLMAVVQDDSISGNGPLLKELGGGLSVFLPKEEAALTRLQPGSQVGLVVTGYQRDQKDPKTGNASGKRVWSWSAIIAKTLLDIGPANGGTIPNPGAVAMTFPVNPNGGHGGPTVPASSVPGVRDLI